MSQKSTHSPFGVPLFSKKQWCIVLIVLALMLCARVGIDYTHYQNLPFHKPSEIEAQVISQYQKTKDGKPYWVLKLSSNAHTLYTTSKEDLKSLQGRRVRIYGKINSQKDCSFMQYFRSCFLVGFSIATLPQHKLSTPIQAYITSQHIAQDANTPINNTQRHATPKPQPESTPHPPSQPNEHGGLFSALFLATTLPQAWREVSNALGLAHIFAISGFHLGIISFVLFMLLAPLYRALQRRYFSYRNESYDLGALVLILLFGYLVVLDFAPSFLRAFVMAAVGFMLYLSGLKLLSFSLLGLCALLCVIAFPSIVFNRGFILSVAGVFYIFVILRYMLTPSHYPQSPKSSQNLTSLKIPQRSKNPSNTPKPPRDPRNQVVPESSSLDSPALDLPPLDSAARDFSALDSAAFDSAPDSGTWASVLLRVLWLHVGVFLLIMPVVHVFFPYFSPWQLVSIPVSMGFVVIFPIAVVLHICGVGGVLDPYLDMVLGLEIARVDITTPWWFACVYLGVSAWAIFSRAGYYALLVCAAGFYGASLWIYSTS